MSTALGRHALEHRLALAIVGGDHDRARHGPLDRGRIPPDGLAVALQDLVLVLQCRQSEWEPVRHVGVLRGDLQRPLLASPADDDLRAAGLERPRAVQGAVDPVVAALEARTVLGEHRAADRERLVEPVHPLADGREVEPVAAMLVLVPGRPESQHRAAAGQHVQRRDHLRQQGRVPVRDTRHERRELYLRGSLGERRERRVPLQHLVRLRAHALDLIEVVHHRHERETRVLHGFHVPDGSLEQLLRRRVGIGVRGHVVAEPGLH